jgi:hypothetical protein
LNSQVNWLFPDKQDALIGGKPGTVDQLAGEAALLGVASITSAQFMDIVILHELSHYKGAIGNPDKDPNVEKKLWKDCIQ